MKKQLSLRLNEAEYKILCQKAVAVGLKKEPFLRCLITEKIPSGEQKKKLVELLFLALKSADTDKTKTLLLEAMRIAKGS